MGFWSNVLLPWGYDFFMKSPELDRRRSALLGRSRGNTLEIGIGTGLNLAYYPAGVTEITGLDPNPGMRRELKKKAAVSRVRVEVVDGGADDMPFDDRTFDTVVSTLVLCSIPDLQSALKEIRRVLKADGSFLFLDHGLSDDARIARWQRRLNPLQQMFADGCKLDVAVDEEIRAAGMSISTLERYYLERGPKTHAHVYDGVAQR